LVKYKPALVVIEDTYLRFGNAQTLKQLTRFSGVAMEICFRSSAEVELITATQARKFCCGTHTGEFKKKEVFRYFVDKYGLSDWKFESDNDKTDAMALVWGYIEKEKSSAQTGNS
jgi:Holliday junction resolvasome RuvABC endonuclease subunit